MMNMRYHTVAAGVALLLFGHAGWAQPADVETRLQQLERLTSSQALMNMLQRLDQQEQELQRLRGRLEEQEHALESLRERQRELYLDTDRRLSRFEREAPLTSSTAAAGTEGATTALPLSAPPSQQDLQPMDEARIQQEREAYQQSFDLLRGLRYEQAIESFRGFVAKYPDGRYAHIAQYWLAEANYAQRKFAEAIQEYQALITHYPNSPKRAEALLKSGYCWLELQQPEKARQTLQELIDRYPNSTEAGQARQRLADLGG